jgi:hypothetical protein
MLALTGEVEEKALYKTTVLYCFNFSEKYVYRACLTLWVVARQPAFVQTN